MTAPAVQYDSNFSVQLVEHGHKPEPIVEGDEIVCAVCRGPLMIVCANACHGALDRLVYARPRECNCGAPLKERERMCEHCREDAKVRRCGCGNALAPRHHLCDGCKATRALAMTRRSCGCGKVLAKSERKCADCRAESRTPPKTTGIVQ